MNLRSAALVFSVVGSLVVALTLDPIPQDPAYHQFADSRAWLGVPNFLDVASNVPLLLVGIAGLVFTARNKLQSGLQWKVFFVGVALVAFGSGYYHLAPNSDALAWDRAPMTIAFMALLAALIGEATSARIGRIVLGPALLVGTASVIHWHMNDDLRLYGWVQFFPLLLIVLILFLFPGRIQCWKLLLGALGLYGFSKLLEALDTSIFDATGGIVAGHALKHLAAAAACLVLLGMLKRRERESVAH
jgi:hypothetical protein